MPTILIVEDHEDTLEVMTRIVASFSYRPLRAHTAEAAFAILVTEMPDISPLTE